MDKKWLILGGLAALALASGGAVAAARSSSGTGSGSGSSGGTGGSGRCAYPPNLPGAYPRASRAEMVSRVRARILETNPGLQSQRLGAFEAASYIAGEIVTLSSRHGIPLEMACAVAWKESSFNPYVDYNLVQRRVNACSGRGDPDCFGVGTELGPYQCKPGVWLDVSRDPREMLTPNEAARVSMAINVGLAYLALSRKRRQGESWCEALLCYTEGPTGSRLAPNRARKASYVAQITAKASAWSELRYDPNASLE